MILGRYDIRVITKNSHRARFSRFSERKPCSQVGINFANNCCMNQPLPTIAPFTCSLSIHAGRGYLDESRMRLLQEVRKNGTLAAAAERLGISYKTAWSWIDAMSNAADSPLVESIQGGSSGGSSVLTVLGLQVLTQYEHLREEHRRWEESMQLQSPELLHIENFLRKLSLHTSARNQLHGRIEKIWGDNVQAWVDVKIDEQTMVTARVSRSSVQDLRLDAGQEICTLTKSTCLTLTRNERPLNLMRGPINRIVGKLVRSHGDEHNVEATLSFAGDHTLTALVSRELWDELDPRLNEEFHAWFEPDHVILIRTT